MPRRTRASRGVSPRLLWTAVAIVAAAGLLLGAWFALSGRAPKAAVEFAELPDGSQYGLAAVFPMPLKEPLALAVADDRLWVAEAGASALRELGAAGQQISTVTVEPSGDVPSYPSDVAVAEGELAVIDQAGTGRVLAMRDDGSQQRPLAQGASAPGDPTAVTADAGTFLVADASSGLVRRYRPDGTLAGELGAKVKPRLGFVGGMSVRDGTLWVSDSNARRVLPIALGSGAPGKALTGGMGVPRGIAVDEFGRVYVADEFAGVVRVYGADQQPLGEIGTEETAGYADGGGLKAPTDVAWLGGRLYVTDRQEGRVKVYNIRAP